MKKTLISIAALMCATCGMAQSSVTLYGVVDANYQRASQGGVSASRLVGSGSNSAARLGVRGSEDLGSGLRASFVLEAGLNVDSGAGAATNTNNQASGAGAAAGLTFDRRSTVSLSSASLGELRLGRDYLPTFWNFNQFDPFTTVGSGNSRNVSQNANVTNSARTSTPIRASHSIGYFLPSGLGGVYGQAMYALGENASNAANSDDGKVTSLRLGYAAGPLNLAVAAARTQLVAGNVTVTNLGGSYNFGVAKALVQLFTDKSSAAGTARTRGFLLGATIPVGSGYVPVSYTSNKEQSGAGRSAKQLAVGYVHNLSKRTAVYATYSRINNANGAAVNGNGGVPGVANQHWTGTDVGLRHTF